VGELESGERNIQNLKDACHEVQSKAAEAEELTKSIKIKKDWLSDANGTYKRVQALVKAKQTLSDTLQLKQNTFKLLMVGALNVQLQHIEGRNNKLVHMQQSFHTIREGKSHIDNHKNNIKNFNTRLKIMEKELKAFDGTECEYCGAEIKID